MKRSRTRLFAVALLSALATLACEQPDPTTVLGDPPGRAALVDRVQELAGAIERQMTAGDTRLSPEHERARDQLFADLTDWNAAHPDDAIVVEHGPVTRGSATSSNALLGWGPLFCKPCPLIVYRPGAIGYLSSQGECRLGAGLERCFYKWIGIAA